MDSNLVFNEKLRRIANRKAKKKENTLEWVVRVNFFNYSTLMTIRRSLYFPFLYTGESCVVVCIKFDSKLLSSSVFLFVPFSILSVSDFVVYMVQKVKQIIQARQIQYLDKQAYVLQYIYYCILL